MACYGRHRPAGGQGGATSSYSLFSRRISPYTFQLKQLGTGKRSRPELRHSRPAQRIHAHCQLPCSWLLCLSCSGKRSDRKQDSASN